MTLTEIEDSLPWGLHDAYLESLDGDALQGRVHLVLRVMMSEAQDLDQRARIEILGLTYLYLEPPEAEAWPTTHSPARLVKPSMSSSRIQPCSKAYWAAWETPET